MYTDVIINMTFRMGKEGIEEYNIQHTAADNLYIAPRKMVLSILLNITKNCPFK